MILHVPNALAAVVELADTRDLKSLGSNTVPVRSRSAAPEKDCYPLGWRSFSVLALRDRKGREYENSNTAYSVVLNGENYSTFVGRGLAPAEIEYTPYGKIAEEQLFLLKKRYPSLKIDQYVIIPNHIHVIFILEEAAGASPRPTIEDIVCAYKSLTTRQCKTVRPIDKLFQTSFCEHVIRGREDYEEIAEYIINNPKQWELDKLYS